MPHLPPHAPMERRLGRGLGSLLGQSDDQGAPAPKKAATAPTEGGSAPSPEIIEGVGRELDLATIRRNADQPRKVFESEALEGLQQSIERHGVLQPICVRRSGDGYEIISGERRWRAARNAGLTTIPAVVRDDVDDEVSLELAIVENVQRQDLDPLEKARGYRALMDRVGLTQEKVAERVGLQRSSVTNHLRLLDLPSEAQDAVSEGLISMGHAKALLGLKGAKEIKSALATVVRKGLSVRETEQLARVAGPDTKSSSKESAGSETPERAVWEQTMETRLREALGVKVTLKNGRGYRGTITLDYSDRAELERICDQIAPKDTI